MAKKQTSFDLKKKLEAGEADLQKFQKQLDELKDKIKAQEQKNNTYRAEYVTLLLQENNTSVEDLEELLLAKPGGE